MWELVAAEPAGQGSDSAIILGLIGALSLILVAAVSGLFALLTAKANRTAPAPPSPDVTGHVAPDLAFRDWVVGELAVGRRRDDDGDERDDIQDRRLDQIERRLDLYNPSWRYDGTDAT